jgi:hypothetical protein
MASAGAGGAVPTLLQKARYINWVVGTEYTIMWMSAKSKD